MLTGSTFGVEISGSHGTRVIRARGRLVVGAGAEAAEWAAAAAFGNVERVVVDLGEVTAIDAGGLGRLVALRQALVCRGARLIIGSASPRVRRLLALTALDAIFGIASGGGLDRRDAASASLLTLCRCA